ncbi:MAG: molybdopterin-dependent oxidoreductase [Steroidobacteraceae bacterium]|nr:molybdopterin-dependent oxidoreductase [Steroidobacteraceae bacterium]MDW8258372.1 molybdopterin cofactor-binding domain-containing protein [Gammaproteobacteria bacterium]
MPSRREVVLAGVACSGGLLLGCRRLTSPSSAAAEPTPFPAVPPPAPAAFGAYIEIAPDGHITIVCPQSEMGQGVHDGLARLVAEELDADWSAVSVRLPWNDPRFVNPVNRRHRTANSDSVMNYFLPLRQAGAAAREMLIAAAAAQWLVPAEECVTRASEVLHPASGRRSSYGALAARAAALPMPAAPRLKERAQFTLIGRSLPRKDTPAKCDGTAQFGIDVRQPEMLYAALHRPPAVSSRLVRFDRDSARALPGCIDAFPISDGVAVVANSTWRAWQIAGRLRAEFDTSASQPVEHSAIRHRLRAALDDDAAALPGRPVAGHRAFDPAATAAALRASARVLEWIYEVPFLAHAALEPLTATALVTADRCEVWAPTQQPDRTTDVIAQVTGLPRERCTLHVTFLGGGFGRKWETDFVRQAVEIASRMRGRPVKLTWTREQDFRHDRFRPAHMVRTRVGLDRRGAITAMHSRISGLDLWRYQGRPPQPGYGDPFATAMLINDRYSIPNPYVDHVATDEPIPIGTWRSVSQSMNGFFSESALDDVAAVTREDPLALRLRLLGGEPRARAVLERAARESGWGGALPRGRGRGIALSMGFGSYCAHVVEVSMHERTVRIERIVCVFDGGLIVDPQAVEAQLVGGTVWGLSAARDGEIRFAQGATVQSNFHDAPILRLPETPPIEVSLIAGAEEPGGCGEAGVPGVAPALAGAIHAASGRRPRRLPLVTDGYRFG